MLCMGVEGALAIEKWVVDAWAPPWVQVGLELLEPRNRMGLMLPERDGDAACCGQ